VTRLKSAYDAVFIAIGLPAESELKIEGVQLAGVHRARELLRKMRSGTDSGVGDRVGVIGGGTLQLK